MPAEFDEPVFDEEFVRNAAFTEPSARERAQPPAARGGGAAPGAPPDACAAASASGPGGPGGGTAASRATAGRSSR